MNEEELQRFRQIEQIFCAALDRPVGGEREALVRSLCGGDSDLLRELTLLLEEHERIRAAVEQPLCPAEPQQKGT